MRLVYALLGAFFAAVTTILVKLGIENVNSNLATAIRTTVVLIVSWGVVFAARVHNQIPEVDQRSYIFLILSGFATGASWLFFNRALQVGQVSQVAPVDKLSLVFTIILAAVILQENITLKMVFGVVLIVAGTIVLIK